MKLLQTVSMVATKKSNRSKKKAAPRKITAAKRAAKKTTPRKRAARSTRVVSDAQKQAMAEGRTQSSTVRRYLEGLDEVTGARRRGRRRTPESIQQRLTDITAKLREVDPLSRLKLVQEKRDLDIELMALTNNGSSVDMVALEKEFVKVAKAYGDRQGITFGAWREIGVPAAILREAGITR